MAAARPSPGAERAGSSVAGGAARRLEIALLNPNRYPEVALRRLRPWLARLTAEVMALSAPSSSSFFRASGPRSRRARSAPPRPVHDPSLGVRFAGDRELRRANRVFRGQDRTTDVLSFAGPSAAAHLGDILISVPAARRQARAAGHSTEREIRLLLLHGLLHCLGFDHETDRGEMARMERRLRRRWLDEWPE